MLGDFSKNGRLSQQYVIIRESQHRETPGAKVILAYLVIFPDLRTFMGRTIYFDHHHRAYAEEIDDVGTNWGLPPKFTSFESLSPYVPPDDIFGACYTFAKMFREFEMSFFLRIDAMKHV